jgi:phosphopantothenoylcysteine synthetase/decarboxylase
MASQKPHNLHVPLPKTLYQKLRQEAELQGQPATVLTRTALELYLQEQERKRLREEFADWIQANAGSELDLDKGLEAAGIESLLANTLWDEDETR